MPGVIRSANTVFSVGFLFGTFGPEGNAGSGNIDDSVPFGQIQEVTFKDTMSVKELMGPGQLTAIAVGVSDVKITGDAKFAAIRARQLQMLRGGSAPTYDGGSQKTTYARGINDEPVPFNLHLLSPDDGSDMELFIYNCICPDLNMSLKLRDFVIPDFTFNAYGDPLTGKLYDILVPGDQTTG